jgi:acetyl esterase/lipase
MLLGDSGDPRDPLVSPLYADPAGLPPLYIQAPRDEGIVDDGRSFADRAQQAGVDVRIDLFPGRQHTFQIGQVGRPRPTKRSGAWPIWPAQARSVKEESDRERSADSSCS